MKRKVLILVLIVFAMGCSKKHVNIPNTNMTEIKPATAEKTKVVKDISDSEELIQDKVLSELTNEDDIIMANDTLFDFDKYTIREDAKPRLNNAAAYLKGNKHINIIIEGNSDERGTNEYNLALGEKRARAARDYLTALGISPSRINFITYGEEKPLCTEQNENCRQKNRRAHIVVQY